MAQNEHYKQNPFDGSKVDLLDFEILLESYETDDDFV